MGAQWCDGVGAESELVGSGWFSTKMRSVLFSEWPENWDFLSHLCDFTKHGFCFRSVHVLSLTRGSSANGTLVTPKLLVRCLFRGAACPEVM